MRLEEKLKALVLEEMEKQIGAELTLVVIKHDCRTIEVRKNGPGDSALSFEWKEMAEEVARFLKAETNLDYKPVYVSVCGFVLNSDVRVSDFCL